MSIVNSLNNNHSGAPSKRNQDAVHVPGSSRSSRPTAEQVLTDRQAMKHEVEVLLADRPAGCAVLVTKHSQLGRSFTKNAATCRSFQSIWDCCSQARINGQVDDFVESTSPS